MVLVKGGVIVLETVLRSVFKSYQELAELAQIDVSYAWQLWHGNMTPCKIDTLYRIKKACMTKGFNISFDDLFKLIGATTDEAVKK